MPILLITHFSRFGEKLPRVPAGLRPVSPRFGNIKCWAPYLTYSWAPLMIKFSVACSSIEALVLRHDLPVDCGVPFFGSRPLSSVLCSFCWTPHQMQLGSHFELNFLRRSRRYLIYLRPFEFPFLCVIVSVVSSLFNPLGGCPLFSPCAFVRFFTFVLVLQFSRLLRFRVRGERRQGKESPLSCTMRVLWTHVQRTGEYTSRESCGCACWTVLLLMVLSTVHCSPVSSAGEC